MNSRYLEDDDLDTDSTDREISLSPSTLLGIFFLLAIICAIFFGFGYSMGHRAANATAAAADGEAAPLHTSGNSKPAPGLANRQGDLTPADAAAVDSSDDSKVDSKAGSTSSVGDSESPSPQPQLQRTSVTHAALPQLKPAVVVRPPAAIPAPGVRPVAAGPSAIVQIAAISHQEDADILVSALKRKGYTVAVRHEPQDKLLHVQLGPFPSRKEADVMKQRLSADGYNAIVK
ncbi:SPOR domain-containing protein [Edaphobacter sp. HDX4]